MNDTQTKIGFGSLSYSFISDPSHAWLRVSLTDLEYSGVKWQISRYSYKSASHVYLEEDCDAPAFLNAMTSLGHDVCFEEKQVEDFDSIILSKALTSYK